MLNRRALIAGLLCASAPVMAQTVQSPVLTIDRERLFAASAFGQRVQREIGERRAALAQENQDVAALLAEEERALTDQRPNLPAEDFRSLAEAYDTRVQDARREQLAKLETLEADFDREERAFFNAAIPVLEQLMREAGAAIVLERDRVLLSSTAIDITDRAIARIDAAIGDGT